MRVNRWLYIAIVLVGAVGLTVAAEFGQKPAYLLAPSIFIAVLTYPLGVLAQGITLPLIYSGIATPAEATTLASPVLALLGYVQWYVVFPRLFRRSSQSSKPASIE